MKDIVISAILIAFGVIGLTHIDEIGRLYADAYPLDQQQQQALDYCVSKNRAFDRLDSAERASCYVQFRGIAASRPEATQR